MVTALYPVNLRSVPQFRHNSLKEFPFSKLVFCSGQEEHRLLNPIEMLIPQHFRLTRSMQWIAQKELSFDIYSGCDDLGGNTAPHRFTSYEEALGLVLTGLDLTDNLSIASL